MKKQKWEKEVDKDYDINNSNEWTLGIVASALSHGRMTPNKDASYITRKLRKLIAQQKEEIKKVVKKDLDNGMFNKICSNETTFMDYLSNLLEKL